MKTFKTLLFSGVLLTSSNVFSNYLLRAPQTSMIEFRSFVETDQVSPYARKQLKSIRENNKSEQEDLISLLEQAQESFLKDHLKNAGDYFRSIVKQAYDKDWNEESQRIIFYSFLRLFQIESKGSTPESFLHSAVLFAPKLEPDEKIFPPPVIKKFKAIKSSVHRIDVHLKPIFPLHEILLINGKEVHLEEKLNLPYGEYRVTALSSSHKAWTRVISLSRLIRSKIITPSWVKGNCTQAIIPENLQNYWTLFPDFCVWKKPLKTIPVQPILVKKKTDIPWNKYAKWVVVGGSAVILAVILAHSIQSTSKTKEMREPQKRKPTRKVGF